MAHSNPKQDPLIGTRFGAYRIQELKGEGGFASVYLAVHESLGRPVAIKVLWPHLARNPDFVGRFLREARAAAGLRHPNIVQVHDAGQQGQYYYIVMDFIEGKSLLDVLQEKKRLDLGVALSIVQQIGSALDYAHGKGVVHRDVKPSNILIDASGKAYLSDFGIAKAAWTSQLTRTGVSLGTPEYMSPEQCEGKEVDRRSDLYSLGVVVYEMLCGVPPFRAETPLGVVYKQVKESPPPLSVWKVKVPEAVEGVVMKAVAKNPGQRFQSGAEMAQALEAAISGTTRRDTSKRVMPTPTPAPVQRQRRTQPLLVAGASILGIIAVVGGLILWSGHSSSDKSTPAVPPATQSTRTTTRIASATPTQQATSTPTPQNTSTPTPTTGGRWTQKAPMSVPRSRPAAVAFEGRLYVLGGTNADGALASVEIYDPETDSWSPGASMPGPKSEPGAAVENGRIYVMGPPDKRLYQYNPATNTWATKAPLPETPAGPVAVASISGRIFVAFGVSGESGCRLYVYDPFQNTWERRSDHPNKGRSISSLGVSNGMIYAVGGGLAGMTPQETTRIDRYDPANDRWTIGAIAPMATRRTHLGATLSAIYGRIFVFGGWDGYTALADAEVYDPWLNSWSALPPMPTARYGAAYAAVGYRIYVIGGNRGGAGGRWLATNEEFSLPEPAQQENPITFVRGSDSLYYEIFTMNPDGSHQLRVTNDRCANWHPTWTSDGKRILFSSDCNGNRDIYSMNPDGSDWRRLTTAPESDHRPFMSPDGRTIAFVRGTPPEEHVWLMNSDGSNQRQLTAGPGSEDDTNIAWSPDSRQVVFRSTRSGNWQLWRINVDGTGLTQLTHLSEEAHDPAWSPDGSTIVFASQGELMLMNRDGSNIRILPGPGWEFRPAWSPDGTRLIYCSWRGGPADIHSKRTDNSDERNLTNTPARDEWDPAWAKPSPTESVPRPMPTPTSAPVAETRLPTATSAAPRPTDTPRATNAAAPTQAPTVAPTVPPPPPEPPDTPVPPTPTRTPIPEPPSPMPTRTPVPEPLEPTPTRTPLGGEQPTHTPEPPPTVPPTHTPEPPPTVPPTHTPEPPPVPSESALLFPDHPSADAVSVMLIGIIVGSLLLGCTQKERDIHELT